MLVLRDLVGVEPLGGIYRALAVTLRPYGDASACLPEPEAGMDPALDFDTQHALTIQVVSAFLAAQLRHDASALDALRASHDPALVLTP